MLVPGRPIISQCPSPTMLIGHFVGHFSVPLLQIQYTYVRDTIDFINKIEPMHLDPDTRLITDDVTSMYTNMTATELVQSAAKTLTKLKQNEVSMKIPQFEYLV